jgi:hypothetical protein
VASLEAHEGALGVESTYGKFSGRDRLITVPIDQSNERRVRSGGVSISYLTGCLPMVAIKKPVVRGGRWPMLAEEKERRRRTKRREKLDIGHNRVPANNPEPEKPFEKIAEKSLGQLAPNLAPVVFCSSLRWHERRNCFNFVPPRTLTFGKSYPA